MKRRRRRSFQPKRKMVSSLLPFFYFHSLAFLLLLELCPVTLVNAYEGKAEAKDKEPKQVKIGSTAVKPKADAKILGKSKKDEDSDDDESDDDSDGKLIPIEGSDSVSVCVMVLHRFCEIDA
jgi:hypothetical protein